jgi:allantoin racemase
MKKSRRSRMKIKVIIPITRRDFIEPTLKEIKRFASENTEISVECLKYGTASIESAYDEMLNAPSILKIVKKAESEGFDGIFIDCMGDPALDAARELVDIPVVGPARISMLYAAELAQRFSILTVLENVIPLEENLALIAGIKNKLASVRSVNIPVLDLKEEKLKKVLVDESVKAIEEDGAHAIVLGCTGMLRVADYLSKSLAQRGYKVPVIYPVAVSIKYLETLILLNLAQSKKTYMQPPVKERNILDRL